MTLRIAYILEATAGGTRKHLAELVSGVRARGHEILVIVNPGRDPDFSDDIAWYAAKGCTVNVVPMQREICPFADSVALFRIVRRLKRFRPDAIHTHAAKAGALGRTASLFFPRAAVIHTPHTLPFEWARGWRRPVYRLLEAAFGRFSDTVIALTNAQAAMIKSARMLKLGRMPAVIPNGAGRAVGLSREEIRRRWGVRPDEVVVAQVARFAPQKACNVFVKAASLVDVPSTRFFLMGDGPLREKLENEARTSGLSPERFHFLGYVPHAERCYAGIDILVLTSLYEGLSYVVLEAMAAGLPVIAPKIPGMDEVVEDGKTGILVPVGDTSAAAEAIATLAANRKLREAFGKNGGIRVKCCFTAEAFAGRHLSLYENLVSSRRLSHCSPA